MDKELLKLTRPVVVMLCLSLTLTGCGTPPAKNFSGPWKPVNHFRNTPTEIPLNPTYVFYASPMDETLKTMLARWAKDSGRELSYKLPFDVTLYQPVAGIRTTDIDAAVAQLNAIYAAQGVSITASLRRIEAVPAAANSSSPTGTSNHPVASPQPETTK